MHPNLQRIFGAHAMAALEMTADQAGVTLADDDRQAVAAQPRQLPAHGEAAGATLDPHRDLDAGDQVGNAGEAAARMFLSVISQTAGAI